MNFTTTGFCVSVLHGPGYPQVCPAAAMHKPGGRTPNMAGRWLTLPETIADFGTVDDTIIADLQRIVGAEWVQTADGELEAYSRDATPLYRHRPDAVVLPRTAAEISGILRLATARRVPVVPRGAGSNLCAATVPIRGGIVVGLSRMNRIKEVSPDEMLAVCEPGVVNNDLTAEAARHGLLYVPDPGSRQVSTIGGNVGTNAGGLRGLKYGVTRNYVLGIEAVLATGEVIRCGGRLAKDVAGYDLTRLICGSEGTLGVITEVTLALMPLAPTSGTGLAYFSTLADASRAVAATTAAGMVPATLEFLDQTCIGAVEEYAELGLDTGAGALLLFGDDGDAETVSRHLDVLGDLCVKNDGFGVEIASTVAQSEELLAARRCSLPALSRRGNITMLEDVSVPRPLLAPMVDQIAAIATDHEVLCGTFGHAGDGNLHPTVVVDGADSEAVGRAEKAIGAIFHAAIDYGGTISGEHGVGLAKLPYLQARLGADQMALLRRVKAAFDPAGILNPGKLGS